MEPTLKAQRKKLVQSLASLARECKVETVRDDAKKKKVATMVDRLRKSKGMIASRSREQCGQRLYNWSILFTLLFTPGW